MPFDILQNATNELFSWHNRTKYHSPHGQEMYNSCKYGDPQGHQEMRMRLAKFLRSHDMQWCGVAWGCVLEWIFE